MIVSMPQISRLKPHMSMSKGGQVSSIVPTDLRGVTRSRRLRRRGDPKSRHFRDTCTSVINASLFLMGGLGLEPRRNQKFLAGQCRGACRLSPGLHHNSQEYDGASRGKDVLRPGLTRFCPVQQRAWLSSITTSPPNSESIQENDGRE
jgi:hypothetical protein